MCGAVDDAVGHLGAWLLGNCISSIESGPSRRNAANDGIRRPYLWEPSIEIASEMGVVCGLAVVRCAMMITFGCGCCEDHA